MMSVCDDDAALSEKHMKEPPVLEQVTCPICLQLFSEPVSLPCGHSYCLACLQTMDAGLDHHCCPECQAVYEGTKAMVKNLEMYKIVDAHKAKTGTDNCDTIQKPTGESEPKQDQEIITQCQEEFSKCPSEELNDGNPTVVQDPECTGRDAPQIGAGSFRLKEEQGSVPLKTAMDVPKFRLASQVTELTLKFEMAENLLRKEEEREAEIHTSNSQLRERTSELLKQMMALLQSYSAEVTELIEAELCPGEEIIRGRVGRASELTRQLRHARLQAESLLTEEDEATFSKDLHDLQPCIDKLTAEPWDDTDDSFESKVNPDRVCSQLEKKNAELRAGLTEAQHSLRNSLNPSELTFDPETAHANLILSENLKTVTFSATKQPYPSSEQRFTNFLQVLSTQSFYGGEHCWEVELEGAPWIIGICYAGKLGRSGLPSALESSRSSWCLMWHDNMLRAFEQGCDVPLKKTKVSHRLEISLSFKTHRLSFYDISPVSGKTHVYTFKANLAEPVNLAYRMMSGQPKARVTICA